jgi:hypothetical protein
MFTAYFDASGTRNSRVITVAGFVSRVNKWKRFEAEWSEILSNAGVSWFHMTDFVSSLGEFKGWKGESKKRIDLLDSLIACISAIPIRDSQLAY